MTQFPGENIIEAQSQYNVAVAEYENIIKNFTCKRFNIGQFEIVYLIEDSFIIYIGLSNIYAVFEEFSHNEIYKFNISAFINKFNINYIHYKQFNGIFGYPIYVKNYGFGTKYAKENIIIHSQFKKVCALLPELQIEERYEKWEGFLYNFIVYELIEGDRSGYAICSTTAQNIHTIAQRRGDDVEWAALNEYNYYKNNGRFSIGPWYYKGVECDFTMIEILLKRIETNKDDGWENTKHKQMISNKLCLAENDMKYFIISTFIKNKEDVYPTQSKILSNAKSGFYSNVERNEYLVQESKWKSEQLVFELTKQLFKNKTVLYQHRPFFLGKLSYDIFVCGENIAIEYQGKQHFESVELFGGAKHLEAQKERDILKAKLSKENGVRLIYVNYWEDISINLLKEKMRVLTNE
jgi:hypothetical protein